MVARTAIISGVYVESESKRRVRLSISVALDNRGSVALALEEVDALIDALRQAQADTIVEDARHGT